MKLFRRLPLFLLLALLSVSVQAVATLTEPQKIAALISSVAQLKGAVFIRNGLEYSGTQAADHLRLKWKNAGSRVKTADDFIHYCASQSSMSGKKYRIRFADGHIVDSEVFFREKLQALNATTSG